MAYKILSGSEVVCDSTYAGSAVNNPVLHMTVNKVWSFEFVLPPDHPFYNRVEEHKTEVAVSLDGEDPIFLGEVYKVSTDFYGQKTVYAEDQLGYFNYAVLPPHRYNSLNVDDIITQMLSAYNSQCSDRPFYKGTITTTHTAHNLAFSTNYDTALTVLQDNIIKKVGGYIYAYYDSTDGKRYLGYKETPDSSGTTQHIKIGYNLLDFVRESDASKLCSILIPLGERLDDSQQNIEGVEKRLTIETAQRQTDRIESASLITAIGRVVKTRIWDSVTDPDSLYTIGSNYLTSQLADVTIEATAFDLNLADAEIERIHLFDNVRVISAPHGLDARFPVMELTLNLNNPSSDKITMGTTELPSISTQTAEASATIADVPTYSDTAAIAARRAAEIIQNATHGYIYFHYDADGVLDEIYIKDSADPDNKWWRWNVAGLGYTSDGGTTYEIAMTMAGELISNLGTIGGWEINSYGLYKTITDPLNSNNRYRVTIYTPDTNTPATSPVFDFKTSTDSGTSWTSSFEILGDGTVNAYGSSDSDARFSIYNGNNLNNYSTMSALGLVIINSTTLANFRSTGLSIYNSAVGSHNVALDGTGLAFAERTSGGSTSTGYVPYDSFGVLWGLASISDSNSRPSASRYLTQNSGYEWVINASKLFGRTINGVINICERGGSGTGFYYWTSDSSPSNYCVSIKKIDGTGINSTTEFEVASLPSI